MNSKKLSELLDAAKRGDYTKLGELKEMISDADYERAVRLYTEYSHKSEEEILRELAKLKHTIPNQQQILETLSPFLNDEQKQRLDRILDYLKES